MEKYELPRQKKKQKRKTISLSILINIVHMRRLRFHSQSRKLFIEIILRNGCVHKKSKCNKITTHTTTKTTMTAIITVESRTVAENINLLAHA